MLPRLPPGMITQSGTCSHALAMLTHALHGHTEDPDVKQQRAETAHACVGYSKASGILRELTSQSNCWQISMAAVF